MSERTRSRELALQILFFHEFNSGLPWDRLLEVHKSTFNIADSVWTFGEELVRGVAKHMVEIDGFLSAQAKNWSLERMAAVDRNILRVAIYEMQWGNTPPKVAINEALEIAKKFGGEDSPSFINGILDHIIP